MQSLSRKRPMSENPIAKLNDRFRKTGIGGQIYFAGELAREDEARQFIVWAKVRAFDEFDEGNDPYGEHDFTIVKHDGETYYGKIDYYDKEAWRKGQEVGSENPADPEKTLRVLTIFNSRDY
jgi:hypothetical protein